MVFSFYNFLFSLLFCFVAKESDDSWSLLHTQTTTNAFYTLFDLHYADKMLIRENEGDKMKCQC